MSDTDTRSSETQDGDHAGPFSLPQGARVAIVGAGVTGLAAAYRLHADRPDLELALVDPRQRVGGVLETVHRDGYQIEQSADNFITTVPWGLDMCRELGLADDVVQTNPATRRTFVVSRGRLHPLPDGFLMMAPTRLWPMAVTPILSPWGKLRALCEYFIPPRKDESDESMAQFVTRRLGREAFQRLVEPLISGVYAADMTKLSVLATLPRFREMETKYGSLIRAMQKQRRTRRGGERQSGARYSMFVTLRQGLTHLVESMASRLPTAAIRLGEEITALRRDGDGRWVATLREAGPLTCDAVVMAAPSHVAAGLLGEVDSELSADLGKIEHSGTAIVTIALDRTQIHGRMDGMGFVVPSVEKSPILAGSFSSNKYTHRAPDGKVLIRVFAGGARAPETLDLSDAALVPRILDELRRLVRVEGEPELVTVARWPRTMPQYHVGHVDLVARIEQRAAALPGFEIAGNAYRGVGIPNCIHSGTSAARRLTGMAKAPSASGLPS